MESIEKQSHESQPRAEKAPGVAGSTDPVRPERTPGEASAIQETRGRLNSSGRTESTSGHADTGHTASNHGPSKLGVAAKKAKRWAGKGALYSGGVALGGATAAGVAGAAGWAEGSAVAGTLMKPFAGLGILFGFFWGVGVVAEFIRGGKIKLDAGGKSSGGGGHGGGGGHH
jgi:hypothetical protein